MKRLIGSLTLALSFSSVALAAAPPIITWEPGKTTVTNGDVVIHNNICYEAKNSPGAWDSPGTSAWFWTEVPCDGKPPVDPIDPPKPDPNGKTVIPDGKGGYLMPRSELLARETSLTSTPLFELVRADIQTLDNASVEAVSPLLSTNPENVQRVESVVNEAMWDFLFPIRNEKYTYVNLLKGIAKFPAFCRTYTDGRNSDEICKRSLATMFAHFVQETGAHAPGWDGAKGNPEWRQGLYFLRERYKSEDVYNGTYNACTGWQGERYHVHRKKVTLDVVQNS